MNSETINWLNQFLTLISSLIGAVSPILVGAWWLRGKIDNLHQISKDISKLETSSKAFEERFNSLHSEFSALKGGIDRDREHYSGLVKAKSPLSLTERGLKVLEESGGKKYIDENKDALIKLINDEGPRTSLDIQELSKKVIELRKEDEKFIPIKEYVYSKGLIFDHVIMALSIYLRDLALAEWSSKTKTK